MSSLTPKIGSNVVHVGNPSNGSFEHPALVTRVWSEAFLNGEQAICCNLTVFPDCSTVPVLAPSCYVFRTKEEGQRSGQNWYAYFADAR